MQTQVTTGLDSNYIFWQADPFVELSLYIFFSSSYYSTFTKKPFHFFSVTKLCSCVIKSFVWTSLAKYQWKNTSLLNLQKLQGLATGSLKVLPHVLCLRSHQLLLGLHQCIPNAGRNHCLAAPGIPFTTRLNNCEDSASETRVEASLIGNIKKCTGGRVSLQEIPKQQNCEDPKSSGHQLWLLLR